MLAVIVFVVVGKPTDWSVPCVGSLLANSRNIRSERKRKHLLARRLEAGNVLQCRKQKCPKREIENPCYNSTRLIMARGAHAPWLTTISWQSA